MDWSNLFRFEWILIELIVLGWAFRELWVLRRDKRRAEEAERAKEVGEG